MIRSAFVLINLFFWTGVLGLVAILGGLADWSGKFSWRMARLWSRILLWVSGVKYRVLGLDKLDRRGHYVFAGNHESAYDIPLTFGALPYHLVPIAKKELKKIPVMGWAMVVAKHIFVDRSHHVRAIESLKRASQSLQKHPRSILVFPEGTRSPDGEVHEFKRGGLKMAITLGIPVVPMALCGTRAIAVKKSFRIHSGDVELRLGSPIDTADWVDRKANEFASFVRDRVVALRQDWLQERITAREGEKT